mgnify:FL=1
MIVLIVNASAKKINDVPIAKNGTEKINTLALTGPMIDVEYIYTDVPNDIAPIDTKKKLK